MLFFYNSYIIGFIKLLVHISEAVLLDNASRVGYKILVASIAIVFLLSASKISMVEADVQPTIELKLHKDFGYSSFGNDAQGNWSVRTTVSEDTVRVEFYLNDTLQYTDIQAPFTWSYYTDDYPLGLYTIKAIAYNSEGNTAVAQVQQNFVSQQDGFFIIIIISIAAPLVIITIISIIKIKKSNKK